jgi:hypothetical protein
MKAFQEYRIAKDRLMALMTEEVIRAAESDTPGRGKAA